MTNILRGVRSPFRITGSCRVGAPPDALAAPTPLRRAARRGRALAARAGIGVLAGALLVGLCPAAIAAEREPAEPSRATELVLRTLSLLGVPYRFGGSSPDAGLDCSGLVRHVVAQTVGRVLPRRSEEMSRVGEPVPAGQLQPGDLVFFNTLRRAFSHVGVYIGHGQFVHAPARGGRVRVETIDAAYWSPRFDGARRLLTGAPGAPPAAPSVREPDASPIGSPERDGASVLEQLLQSIPSAAVPPRASIPATSSAGAPAWGAAPAGTLALSSAPAGEHAVTPVPRSP